MYYYSNLNVDDVAESIDDTNKLLSEKISQLSKSSPDSTYTLKQVTDMLTEIGNKLDAESIKTRLSDIGDHIDELEDQSDRLQEEYASGESMHTYIDFVLDHLPASASLADREEIAEMLKKCNCLK